MADLDWEAQVRPNQTVVIYMGLSALPEICRQLMAHGTLATQQVLTGTLADLPAKVATSGFTSPSLLIVGDVVKLHGSLHWFDPVPRDDSRLTHSGPVQLPINLVAAN